jgi:hypothetical protein
VDECKPLPPPLPPPPTPAPTPPLSPEAAAGSSNAASFSLALACFALLQRRKLNLKAKFEGGSS